jgi:hypothetical protein
MMAPQLRIVGLAACAALAWSAQSASAAPPGDALRWREPWRQPHDARAAASISDQYAWRLFVAVNWPADTLARTADSKAAFGAERPTVWETWQNTSDIFLDDGADPGPWVSGATAPSIADPRRFETLSLKDLPNARHIVGGRMVPLLDPVSRARRLTETRMNRAAFEYIRAHELYNLNGQLKLLTQRRAPHFPAGATEVKAKWRPIRAEERARYHSLLVRLPDGTTRLYGLTALHVVTKDLPDWFWATFEQVDNPSLPDADGWQLPSRDRFGCSGGKADCNRAPAGIGLEGTVWQFYRLRGTLTRFVDAGGQPLRLANSELEAGMQQTSSCITCHARASIGMVAGAPARLSLFETRAGAAADDPAERRGYLGRPQAAWFNAAGDGGNARPPFQALDFVWSLSMAQPKRDSQ